MNHPWLPTRRQLLQRAACGFGYLAAAGLAAGKSQAAAAPLAARAPHFTPRAKRVIFLFMPGGPAHMDTFDYKPRLQQLNGKDLPFEIPKLQQTQKRNLHKLLGSPFKFKRHGDGGLWISELFPLLARQADKLCVLNGMHTDGVDHGQATIKLHTGNDTLIRPSMGAWVNYGLGTENQNLPGMVTICPKRGAGGARNYGNAFLPAIYQGTAIGNDGVAAKAARIRFASNDQLTPELQKAQLEMLGQLNRGHLERAGHDPEMEGMIEAMELAFRMQSVAPDIMNVSRESEATLKLYGIGEKETDDFGRQCLMARRFAEAGVRFIQVTHSLSKAVPGIPDWDQHASLNTNLPLNCRAVDRPIAALLADLEARGLLEDTLVWWGGEFGRTPVAEYRGGSKIGRDHNPYGFTMWLAGAGVKGGFAYGATDDFGYHAARDKVHMHDMHATILHLLGLDHEKLTYRYAGRDFRLTDVYGRIVQEILS